MLLPESFHDSFFSYIQKRQEIWYNRFILNKPREEWTDDLILKKYKFCNVFRELDAGTRVIFDNVINNESLSLREKFINIVAYRFFNTRWYFDKVRIIRDRFSLEEYRKELKTVRRENGKIFNIAYRICPNKIDHSYDDGKESQVAYCIKYTYDNADNLLDSLLEEKDPNRFLKTIMTIPLVGPFLSYQIALDLIYTKKTNLDDNSRLHVGPGAEKILKETLNMKKIDNSKEYIDELYNVQWKYTSKISDIYPPKELIMVPHPEKLEISWNNIEFNLCEFRKYTEFKNGEGKKRAYHPYQA